MKSLKFLCIAIAAVCTSLSAQDMLDLSFNSSGKVVSVICPDADYINAVAIQSDGKIVAVGQAKIGSATVFAIVRYNSDGSLDNSFGTSGVVTTAIGTSADGASDVEIQSDGKILVSGYTFNTTLDIAVVRYNSNGTLDLSFNSDGMSVFPIDIGNDGCNDMILQADGKILLGGSSVIGGVARFALARLNTDGSLDNTFDTDGVLTTSFGTGASTAYGLALQADGKIIAAGVFTAAGPAGNDFALARYNSDGSLDLTFDGDGKVNTNIKAAGDKGTGVLLSASGKILVCGEVDVVNEEDNFGLAQYNSDGSLDMGFGTSGVALTDFAADQDVPSCMAMQADGKIILAGSAYSGTSFLDFALVRYNANGSLDNGFGTGGKLITDMGAGTNVITGIAIQSDGKIVVGGSINAGPTSDFALARYMPGQTTSLQKTDHPVFYLYPNPNKGEFTLQLTEISSDFSVEIFSTSGQRILKEFNKMQINLGEIAAGVYWIQLRSGEVSHWNRLIISR